MARLPPDLEEQKTTNSSKPGTAESNPLYQTAREFIEEDIQESTSLMTAKKISQTDDDQNVKRQKEKLQRSLTGVLSIPDEDPPNNCKSKHRLIYHLN